jgi:hypothetical protein
MNLSGKKILVRQEPELVLPENYKAKNTANFWKIINVGSKSEKGFLNINWPQNINGNLKFINERKRGKIILLNSNLISLHKSELYSLRREAAYKLDAIDLFGYGWNNSIFERLKSLLLELKKFINKPHKLKFSGLKYYFRTQKNYKGKVDNKILAMQHYSIALIIENSPTYVSEKIFDAFSAGCIPIYIGPDLNEFEIPNNLFIQANPNLNSIMDSFNLVQEMDYQVWFDHLNKWLNSSTCRVSWEAETYLFRIKKLIDN